jgi:hypothetical protein
VEQNQDGIGIGTLLLSFVTGIAAGVAAALLIDASREKNVAVEKYEDPTFI